MRRWEVIASYITQHLPASKKTAKEVLAQAKTLQKDDSIQRRAANDSAFDRAMKTSTVKVAAAAVPKQEDPSMRYMCKFLHTDDTLYTSIFCSVLIVYLVCLIC